MTKKKAKKAAKKPTSKKHLAHAKARQSKTVPVIEGAPPVASALGRAEVTKIQGLLKSKTAEGVTLGMSLLQSLGATAADYEAVFTEPIKKAVSRLGNDWWQGGDATRAEYERYHAAVVRPAYVAFTCGAVEARKPFIDLVDIPAGAFVMGSPDGETYRCGDEKQVRVRITKAFAMGRTPVTQGQWRAVMGTEPWRPAWAPRSFRGGLKKNQCGDDFPAVFVGWLDAVRFCQTLTHLERETGRLATAQSYRLPTEAEWEYACRAGTTTAYSFGDSPSLLDDYGWNDSNSGHMLHEVALKKPNPWGLFDMHGNVWEWCSDLYCSTLAGGDDPQGASTGAVRVRRGGSWCDESHYCRSAFRFSKARGIRLAYYGFRVVCV